MSQHQQQQHQQPVSEQEAREFVERALGGQAHGQGAGAIPWGLLLQIAFAILEALKRAVPSGAAGHHDPEAERLSHEALQAACRNFCAAIELHRHLCEHGPAPAP